MKYNIFKKSGITVSDVSFGCMSLTADNKQNDTILNKAIDNGINLFDTADLYEKGQNEVILGKVLGAKRKNFVISTKVGNKWRDDGSGWDWRPSKNYILQAADGSLQRLGTDYIDIYLLHGGTLDDPQEEILEAFESLLQQGKIRSYGISSIRPNIIRQYAGKANVSAVMTQYSLLDRRPEEETLQVLMQNEIGVMARGTVAGGLLLDKPARDYLDIPASKISQVQKDIRKNTADNRPLHEAAVKYVTSHPAVVTAVMGIRTIQQLDEAVNTANAGFLTVNEIKNLKKSWNGTTYTEHR